MSLAPSSGTIPVVGYGTTLPASPTDGQQFMLVDSTANPSYQWLFRYNAGSVSAFKWEFIGGTPVQATVDAYEGIGTANSTWLNLTTNGPLFTVPRAGDFLCTGGADTIGAGSISNSCFIGIAAGDTTPVAPFSDSILNQSGYNPEIATATTVKLLGVAASTAVKLRYLVSTGGSNAAGFGRRWLTVVPIRVS